MALGSSQPLTEISTRNLPGGKGRPVHKADNLTAICEPIGKCKSFDVSQTLWVSTACYSDSFTFTFYDEERGDIFLSITIFVTLKLIDHAGTKRVVYPL
jgi:hypothetical protein